MAIDLRKAYYNDGTASVTAGMKTVTGQGTAWAQAIRRGDMFGTHVGMPTRIESVDSNTQITLAYPWTGPDQAEAAYEIQFTFDDVAYQAAVRDLLTALANGNIAALAALTLAEGRYLRGTGPGGMETVNGANLDALVGLTGAADKLSFFTGEGQMALTALTAAARAVLGLSGGNGKFIAYTTSGADARDIVGTVSHSGGVPTGAIVERGLNSSGYYVRFADGTQICVKNFDLGTLSYSPGQVRTNVTGDWNYPAAFQATPTINAILESGWVYDFAYGPEAVTQSTLSNIHVKNTSSASRSPSQHFYLSAIGRWY